MWHSADLVWTGVSEECIASIFRVRRHITEDGFLHSHSYENLKSYTKNFFTIISIPTTTEDSRLTEGGWSGLENNRRFCLENWLVC
jgi:hypothetical protein